MHLEMQSQVSGQINPQEREASAEGFICSSSSEQFQGMQAPAAGGHVVPLILITPTQRLAAHRSRAMGKAAVFCTETIIHGGDQGWV